MNTYVQFEYPSPGMFQTDERERDIRLVKNFDIQTLHVPKGAIGFTPFEAKNKEEANKIDVSELPTYYLALPVNVMTTDQMRENSKAEILIQKMILNMSKNVGPADALLITAHVFKDMPLEDVQKMAETYLSPEDLPKKGEKDLMTEFRVLGLEYYGCHRAIGSSHMNYMGVKDHDIILHQNTREIISPALDPSQVPPRPPYPYPKEFAKTFTKLKKLKR